MIYKSLIAIYMFLAYTIKRDALLMTTKSMIHEKNTCSVGETSLFPNKAKQLKWYAKKVSSRVKFIKKIILA
jgi:hypothetical protein